MFMALNEKKKHFQDFILQKHFMNHSYHAYMHPVVLEIDLR